MRPPSCDVRAFAFIIGWLCAGPASAQSAPSDPLVQPPFVIGPAGAVASVGLKDVGVDSNVFNSSLDPQSDYTGTLETALDLGAHAGRARVRANIKAAYVYFEKFRSENSLNANGQIRVEVPLGRLTPFVSHSYLNTRQRPEYEIDARPRRIERTSSLGTEVRVSGKTALMASVQRARVNFDAEAIFLGTHLREVLNRDEESALVALRYAVTPLSTVVVEAEGRRDSFHFAPHRDAVTSRVGSGVEFNPLAALHGSASVGIRRFQPRDARAPEFLGVVAAVNLSTRLSRVTLSGDMRRDLNYSFDPTLPYYLVEGGVLGASVHAMASLDVSARIGGHRLTYRHAGSGGVVQGSGHEAMQLVGAGIGYRFGLRSRIGIDADYYQRISDANTRRFRGLRVTSSLTLGL